MSVKSWFQTKKPVQTVLLLLWAKAVLLLDSAVKGIIKAKVNFSTKEQPKDYEE